MELIMFSIIQLDKYPTCAGIASHFEAIYANIRLNYLGIDQSSTEALKP